MASTRRLTFVRVSRSNAHGGLVDDDTRQRARIRRVGDRLADVDLIEAGERHDVAGPRLVDLDALEPFEHVEVRHAPRCERTVVAGEHHGLPRAHGAVDHPADREAPDVLGIVQVEHQHLERRVGRVARRGDRAHDLLEQDLHAMVFAVGRAAGDPGAGIGVQDRELELVLVRIEVDEQVVDLVEHRLRPGVLAVDLVDDDDGREAQLERLAEHEPGLGQRPFARVHQQQHAVHHLERPLDLAAEVGVPGRVDDVDLALAPPDRRVLGEDRDSLLALEIVGIEHALDHLLVLPENAALPQQAVHERRFAVVHVGDDGDVAQILAHLRRGRSTGPGQRGIRHDPAAGRARGAALSCRRSAAQ